LHRFEYFRDERSRRFTVRDWIPDAHCENSALALFIAVPPSRTGAKRSSKKHQLAMFIRIEEDDMGGSEMGGHRARRIPHALAGSQETDLAHLVSGIQDDQGLPWHLRENLLDTELPDQ